MSKRTFLIIVSLLVLSFLATLSTGLYVWRSGSGDRANLIGGAYTLVDQTGATRTESSWPSQYKLIYFGYTYCPDFCPTTLTIMTDALSQLDPNDAAQIKPMMISIDPERDTVEALAQYHEHFDPRFAMLTGTTEQVKQAAQAYRVYFAKAESEAATDYLMDHSSFTYLMAPDGSFVTHFVHDTTAEQMADQLRKILEG
jgi:protein SCO1/2